MPNANGSSINDYLGKLYTIKPLPQEEEESLAGMIAAGDRAALDKLVKHNLRFVVSKVKEMASWHHGNVPMEDLISMGNEALVMAARKWRPKNGARFITYASPFIEKGVQRGLDNEWKLIRVPVNVSQDIRRMKYAERILTQKLGREPTDQELCDKIEMHPKKLTYLRECLQREPTSLEAFNPEKFQEEGEE